MKTDTHSWYISLNISHNEDFRDKICRENQNTHSEYVIFIAYPLQQWLKERVSLLHYTRITCLVTTNPPSRAEHKEQRLLSLGHSFLEDERC